MKQLKISKTITNRDEWLDKYLWAISKIPMLSADEETRLWEKIRTTPENSPARKIAIEKMVKANLRFVVSVAKQYVNNWLSLSDLVN